MILTVASVSFGEKECLLDRLAVENSRADAAHSSQRERAHLIATGYADMVRIFRVTPNSGGATYIVKEYDMELKRNIELKGYEFLQKARKDSTRPGFEVQGISKTKTEVTQKPHIVLENVSGLSLDKIFTDTSFSETFRQELSGAYINALKVLEGDILDQYPNAHASRNEKFGLPTLSYDRFSGIGAEINLSIRADQVVVERTETGYKLVIVDPF